MNFFTFEDVFSRKAEKNRVKSEENRLRNRRNLYFLNETRNHWRLDPETRGVAGRDFVGNSKDWSECLNMIFRAFLIRRNGGGRARVKRCNFSSPEFEQETTSRGLKFLTLTLHLSNLTIKIQTTLNVTWSLLVTSPSFQNEIPKRG